MKDIKTFEKYDEANRVLIRACVMERAVSVELFGGDSPHIGAVSVWDEKRGECITVDLPTHKEAVISKMLAEDLGRRLDRTVSVTAGIHYDNFTPEILQSVMQMTKDIAARIAEFVLQ